MLKTRKCPGAFCQISLQNRLILEIYGLLSYAVFRENRDYWPEVYLGLTQIIWKKAPSYMFGRVWNTPLAFDVRQIMFYVTVVL